MLIKIGSKVRVYSSSLGVLALMAMPTHAQQAVPSPSVSSADQSTDIESVIVTARRRSERAEDVPAAITVYTANDLARYDTQSVAELANETPQVSVVGGGTPAGALLSIRGISTASATPTVDQSVLVSIDGIPISQGNAIKLGFYDLDRVEILKGPQALFYGKNSPAGVISLISADPGNQFEAKVRTGYEFENKQIYGEETVSIPLSAGLGLRLDAYQSTQDGWFRNLAQSSAGTAFDQTEYFGRVTLQYGSPNGGFRSNLKVSAGDLEQPGGANAGSELISCPLGIPQGAPPGSPPCGLGRNYSNADMSAAAAATSPFWGDGQLFFKNRQFLTSWKSDLTVADHVTLTSVTGYYNLYENWDGNYSGGYGQALFAGTLLDLNQFTQELRFLSDFDSPVNFLFGGFYEHANMKLDEQFTFAGIAAAAIFGPGAPPVLVGDDAFRHTDKTYSGFGQLLWKINGQWELDAGGRYTSEKKDVVGTRMPSLTSGFMTVPIPFDPSDVSFSNFSPEATLTYHLTPQLNLYGAYRSGFSSGGFNLIPNLSVRQPNQEVFQPETAKGGEVGMKGTLFDQQIQFDMNAYFTKYTNLQVQTYDPDTVSFTVRNAASSSIRGAELNVNGTPHALPDLVVRASLAYNDGHYDSYPDAACYVGQTQAMGCTGNVVGGVASTQNLGGQPLPLASTWSGLLGATYHHPLTGNLNFRLSAEANYTGPYVVVEPITQESGAWRMYANITLYGANDSWEVSLIGRNLANVLRASALGGQTFTGFGTGTTGPSFPADQGGFATEPRTIALQFTIKSSAFQ